MFTIALALTTSMIVAAADDPKSAPKAVATKISGLSATAPAAWVSEKPANRLRSYQFKLPAATENVPAAELSVYPESSPKWEDKFREWKETVILADDAKPEDVVKTSEFKVGDAVVHMLDVSGTWKYRERPRDPTSKEMLKPAYRVVWLIFIGKEETTHIRVGGPASVMSKHLPDVIAWVRSLK